VVAKDSLSHLYTLSNSPSSNSIGSNFYGSYTPPTAPLPVSTGEPKKKGIVFDGLAISEWSVVEEPVTQGKDAVEDNCGQFGEKRKIDDDALEEQSEQTNYREFKIEEKKLKIDDDDNVADFTFKKRNQGGKAPRNVRKKD
ncbi:hypothetical protein HK096_007339, partial [Nowakowskiella sp. JEL0078]